MTVSWQSKYDELTQIFFSRISIVSLILVSFLLLDNKEPLSSPHTVRSRSSFHVLEPTRGDNVLDIVLSSQKELVNNVKIHEPLGNNDHNQIHFDINVKSESKNKKPYRRNFHKSNYKDMRKYLAKLDWNNMLEYSKIRNWDIIDKFVHFKIQR